MSLKSLHIFFITLSTLLSFGFGVWAILFYTAGHGGFYLFLGIFSILVGFGLIYYGVRFLRKLKHIGFM